MISRSSRILTFSYASRLKCPDESPTYWTLIQHSPLNSVLPSTWFYWLCWGIFRNTRPSLILFSPIIGPLWAQVVLSLTHAGLLLSHLPTHGRPTCHTTKTNSRTASPLHFPLSSKPRPLHFPSAGPTVHISHSHETRLPSIASPSPLTYMGTDSRWSRRLSEEPGAQTSKSDTQRKSR